MLVRMKLSGEQVHDRIVEVHWDPQLERWRMMRFRDDKPHGNFRKVVEDIIRSIVDGVEKSTVRLFLVYLPLLTRIMLAPCPWPSHSKRVESTPRSATAK